jgi:hypothetical protein
MITTAAAHLSNPSNSQIDFDSLISPTSYTPSEMDVERTRIPREADNMFRYAWWVGLGTRNRWYRYFYQGCLLCMIFVQPQCAVTSSHSWLYPQRHTSFAQLWFVLSVAVGAGLFWCHWCLVAVMDEHVKQRRESPFDGSMTTSGQTKCLITRGHMVSLLSEVNFATPSAKTLHLWLTWGFRMSAGISMMVSLQGVYWLYSGWFSAQFGPILHPTDSSGLILWVFFYCFGLPAQCCLVCFALLGTGVANAATTAHLGKIHVLSVADYDTELGQTGNVAITKLQDDMMHILTDVNTRTIPMNMAAFNTPFALLYCLGLSGGLGFMYNTVLTYSTSDTATSSSGGDASAIQHQRIQNLILAFISIIGVNVGLLIPAQTSTMCTRVSVDAFRTSFITFFNTCIHGMYVVCSRVPWWGEGARGLVIHISLCVWMVCVQVVGTINEFRRCSRALTSEPSLSYTSARIKHVLASDSDIVRLECLSAYIREANGGRGMVRPT